MSILESLANALSGLMANKLRSMLTMLGVIIGVGAIITTTSIGEGAKADITARIQTLGANILAIRPGQSRFRGRGSADTRKSLTIKDMAALEERGQSFGYVTPEVSSRAQVKYLNKNTNTTIVGTSPGVSHHGKILRLRTDDFLQRVRSGTVIAYVFSAKPSLTHSLRARNRSVNQ